MADTPPFDPRAVANLLLDLAEEEGLAISNLALQKLIYFAHGHFLIATKGPLVKGAFEAWNNGPVHPSLYHAFKTAGRDPIRFRAQGKNLLTGDKYDLPAPSDPAARRVLRKVVDSYAHLSAGLLVTISHAPRGPWATIRDDIARGASIGGRIPDEVTRELFGFQKATVGKRDFDLTLDDDEPLTGALLQGSRRG